MGFWDDAPGAAPANNDFWASRPSGGDFWSSIPKVQSAVPGFKSAIPNVAQGIAMTTPNLTPRQKALKSVLDMTPSGDRKRLIEAYGQDPELAQVTQSYNVQSAQTGFKPTLGEQALGMAGDAFNQTGASLNNLTQIGLGGVGMLGNVAARAAGNQGAMRATDQFVKGTIGSTPWVYEAKLREQAGASDAELARTVAGNSLNDAGNAMSLIPVGGLAAQGFNGLKAGFKGALGRSAIENLAPAVGMGTGQALLDANNKSAGDIAKSAAINTGINQAAGTALGVGAFGVGVGTKALTGKVPSIARQLAEKYKASSLNSEAGSSGLPVINGTMRMAEPPDLDLKTIPGVNAEINFIDAQLATFSDRLNALRQQIDTNPTMTPSARIKALQKEQATLNAEANALRQEKAQYHQLLADMGGRHVPEASIPSGVHPDTPTIPTQEVNKSFWGDLTGKVRGFLNDEERLAATKNDSGYIGQPRDLVGKFSKGKQGLYHGSETGFDPNKTGGGNLGKGIYLTDHEGAAKYYSYQAKQGNQLRAGVLEPDRTPGTVSRVELDPSAKLKTLDHMPSRKEVEALKQQGYYDGINYPDETFKVTEDWPSSISRKEYPENSRATFLFDNSKISPTKGKQADPLDTLKAEALKYKSADEFMQATSQKRDPASIDTFLEKKFGGKVFEYTDAEGITKKGIKIGDNAIRYQVFDQRGQILLPKVYIDKKGSGLGQEFMQALKELADSNGKNLVVNNVENPKFFDKFSWLEKDGSTTYRYKNKTDLTDLYNQAHKKKSPLDYLKSESGHLDLGAPLGKGDNYIEKLARTATDEDLIKLSETDPDLVREISKYRTEQGMPNQGTTAKVDKTRGFVKGVKNSPEVSDDTQKMVEGTYTPKQNKDLEARANQRVADGTAAEYLDTATSQGYMKDAIDVTQADEVVATTIAQAKHLDAKGDRLGAAKLYSEIAEKLTYLGRGVQAASLLARQTPEGQLLQAERAFKAAGIEVSPEVRQALGDAAEKMRESVNLRDRLEIALEGAQNTVQRKIIAKQLKEAETQVQRDRYNMGQIVANNLPAERVDQVTSIWKAGLLSALTTLEGAGVANVVKASANIGRDALSSVFDQATSRIFNGGNRSNIFSVKSQFARGTGTKEGVLKGYDYVRTGFDERNIADARDAAAAVFKGDNVASWAGKAWTNSIFRPLGMVDQPFFYGELRKSLVEQAEVAAKNAGVKGRAKSDFIDDFLSNPPTTARSLAEKEANDATFTNPTMLGKVAASIKRTMGEHPAGKALAELLIPFARIPSAVATAVVNYTPAGAVKELIDATLVKRGKGVDVRQLNRALADSTMGTGGAMAIGASLYASGNFTLATPTTDAERAIWERDRKKPYSININGHWVSLNYVQPFGSLMAMGAAYHQAQKDGQTLTGQMIASAAAGGQAVTQQSFLKGVAGAIAVLSDPARKAEIWAENTIGSIVPNVVKRVAQAQDTKDGEVVARDPDGAIESIMNGIPGLRDDLAAKRDEFGNEITTGQGPLGTFFDPFKTSKARGDDALSSELRRLASTDKENNIYISKDKVISVSADGQTEEIKLSTKEASDYNAAVGKATGKAWQELIGNDDYKALSDAEKVKALRNAKDDAKGVETIKQLQTMGKMDQADKLVSKLSERTIMASQGNMSASDYANGVNGLESTKIAPSLDPMFKSTLQQYNKLNTVGKEKFMDDPRQAYELKLAQFENDKASGKLTGAKTFTQSQALQKQAVTSNYSQEVTDLYNLSLTKRFEAIQSDPTLVSLMPQVNQLAIELGEEDKIGAKAPKVAGGRKAKAPRIVRPKAAKRPALAKVPKPKKIAALKQPKMKVISARSKRGTA